MDDKDKSDGGTHIFPEARCKPAGVRMRHLVSCLLQAVTITYITDNAYLQWMFISWSTSWDFHYKWANVIGAFHKNLGQNACEVLHGSLLV